MTRVLFVLEGGIGTSQEIVRGEIFRDLFARRGIEAHYVNRRPKPPIGSWHQPGSRLAREVASSLEFRAAWWVADRAASWLSERRIAAMARDFDAVHLIKGRSLRLLRQIRRHTGARVLYDLADALWLPRHLSLYPDLAEMLRSVDCVTCDNQYTLEFARQHARAVAIWPSASQVELFDAYRARRALPGPARDRVVIGWIGSPGTAFHLYAIWEALERVFAQHEQVHLRLVGVGAHADVLPPFERVRWSALPFYGTEEMMAEVSAMDIGLFPMFDVEDARTRGVLKALVYMSGGAAVLCSPRGEVGDVVQDGVNGLLASSQSEWVEKLSLLIRDGQLRSRLAQAGLETARSRFSLKRSFQGLCEALGV